MPRTRKSRSKNDENDNGNKKKKSGFWTFAKWTATMGAGAIIGAIAVDKYREIKSDKSGQPQMNPAHQAMQALFGNGPNPFGPNVHVTNFSGSAPPGFMMMPEPPKAPEPPAPPSFGPPEPEDTRPDPADIDSEDY